MHLRSSPHVKLLALAGLVLAAAAALDPEARPLMNVLRLVGAAAFLVLAWRSHRAHR
jgi:hypothetical protein